MKQEHPLLEEELMAFADGQLDGGHAERIGLHLKECSECTQAVAEARQLSQQLSVWKIEESSERMTKSVLAALESHARRRNSWLPEWWTRSRTLRYSLSGAVAVLILAAIFVPLDFQQHKSVAFLSAPSTAFPADKLPPPYGGPLPGRGQGQGQAGQPSRAAKDRLEDVFSLEKDASGTLAKLQLAKDAPSGPMVIRTIQLMLIARNFESARTGIESIVRDSKGYIDSMTVQTNPGIPKSLSAVVRIPADRLDASLVSLRKLGQPRQESQNSTDISGQYVDLVARLNNSRNTEQRLLTLLRERTGNLKDIVAAEGELSRVREQIEQMEAQRKSLDNKVQYASVQVEVSEEYHAELQPSVPATGARFHNAAVEGLDSAAETVMGMALAGLSYGPAALIWLAVAASIALAAKRMYQSLMSRRRLRSAGSL